MIDQGNKSSGGVKIVCPKVYGIIGTMMYTCLHNINGFHSRFHSIFTRLLHVVDFET